MTAPPDRAERLRAMVALCEDILDAEEEAERANDPDTQREARARGVRSLWQIVRHADSAGMVSQHYADASGAETPDDQRRSPETIRKRRITEAAVRFLQDASGPQGALQRLSDVSNGALEVSAYLLNRLLGLRAEDPLPDTKAGSRNLPASVHVIGARQRLADVVRFKAGRDGVTVEEAFQQTAPGRSFEAWRKSLRKPVPGELIGPPEPVRSEERRAFAQEVGRLVAANAELDTEAENLAERCKLFLSDSEKLAELLDMAIPSKEGAEGED